MAITKDKVLSLVVFAAVAVALVTLLTRPPFPASGRSSP